jgi:hypothetical protein
MFVYFLLYLVYVLSISLSQFIAQLCNIPELISGTFHNEQMCLNQVLARNFLSGQTLMVISLMGHVRDGQCMGKEKTMINEVGRKKSFTTISRNKDEFQKQMHFINGLVVFILHKNIG